MSVFIGIRIHGFVVAIDVTNGGAGYSVPPLVSILGGGGTGATATAIVAQGVVREIVVNDAGVGYTGTPEVSISPPEEVPVPFSQGLLAYYPFNGSVLDESGNGHNGTARDLSFGPDRFGRADRAGAFNGRSTSVSIPHLPVFNALPITVCAWVKSITPSQDAGILTKYASRSGNGWGLFAEPGGLVGWYFGSTGDLFPGDGVTFGQLAAGQWRHIAATFSTNGAKYFVDGVLTRSLSWDGQPSTATTTRDILIGEYGALSGLSSTFFRGSIDDVRIYGAELSEASIKDLFEFEAPVTTRVSIAVQTVQVVMHVKSGRRYQLLSSFDTIAWTNVGDPVYAKSDEIRITVNVLSTGQYFKAQQVF